MPNGRRQPKSAGRPDGVAPGRLDATNSAIGIGAMIREHPVVALAAAAGLGILLQLALAAASQRPASGAAPRRRARRPSEAAEQASLEQGESAGPAPERRRRQPATHDVGAADIEFTTTHADGKSVVFRFTWKKRPIEAPETEWPTDDMGFTATRADGKRTAFRFTRKTRPVPTESERLAGGERYRPGLGRADMEFRASRPGQRDFHFTWTKKPPPEPADSASRSGVAAKRADRPAALRVVKNDPTVSPGSSGGAGAAPEGATGKPGMAAASD